MEVHFGPHGAALKEIMRKISVLIAIALAAAACGGSPAVYEVAPDDALAAAMTEGQLPEPKPATPAFVVQSKKKLSSAQIEALKVAPGAAVVAPISLGRVKVKGPKGGVVLKVGAVNPLQFRSVAPLGTRDADFVWTSLLAGDAIVTSEAGKTLGLRRKPLIKMKGIGELRVGALADNGTPNLVDVLVDGQQIGLGDPEVAVIGASTGTTLQSLADEIRRSVPSARVRRLIPKTQSVAPEPDTSSPGVPAPVVAGLHPVMAESIDRIVAAGNGRIWVVSGYRSSAHQYQLWINALAKYGSPEAADNWVAPPGHSFHERGLAVDLGGDLNLAVQLIAQLRLPLWRPMSWEPWHFELVGSRG